MNLEVRKKWKTVGDVNDVHDSMMNEDDALVVVQVNANDVHLVNDVRDVLLNGVNDRALNNLE